MILGGVMFVVGAVIYFGDKWIPFGRLPGDFRFERENFSFHFPLMTSIVLSLALTLILNLIFRK